MRELVEYPLTHPEIYAHLGVEPPRGLLLHGPPGCGKTLLACSIAAELGCAFLRISAPEVVSGMSGESEAKIRQLFQEAATLAPALIFIDEIDAIAPKREMAQREMERRIVAQLLTCMDELSLAATGGQTVIVMGATNRPDAIDPALRRAGRFDREIALGIPDTAARERILRVLCERMRLAGDLDLGALAKRCNGFVGADLAALCKEAAVVAVNRIFGDLFGVSGPTKPESSDGFGHSGQAPVAAAQAGVPSGSAAGAGATRSAVATATNGLAAAAAAADKDDDEPMAEEDEAAADAEEAPAGEAAAADEEEEDEDASLTRMRTTRAAAPDALSPEEAAAAADVPLPLGGAEAGAGAGASSASSALVVVGRGLPADQRSHRSRPLSADALTKLAIRMCDFEQGLLKVQPSARREGFATIPDVTWDEVGALQELRHELHHAIIEPINHPERFEALGLKPSCGVLLHGPPGCGKTLLAKAIANESGASFISVKGPELLNKYVGESERAVRQLFARGRASSPCVVFFDELDALVPRRGGDSSNQASERVVNQMLTEMDGLDGNKQLFVVAATNRPDMIDPAMLRPGRLDKLLYVPLPTPAAREDILRTASRKMPLDASVVLGSIARDRRCEGFSGADLSALAREAAVGALKACTGDTRPVVTSAHFEAAFSHVFPSVSPHEEANYLRAAERLRNARAKTGARAKAEANGLGAAAPAAGDEHADAPSLFGGAPAPAGYVD